MGRNEEYSEDSDELLNKVGHRWRYVSLWDGFGGVDICEEESWKDPLNHPALSIQIDYELRDRMGQLTAVLMHELVHYFYWYTGRGYDDLDREFIERCEEMGLPCGTRSDYDPEKVSGYIRRYLEHALDRIAGGSKEKAKKAV